MNKSLCFLFLFLVIHTCFGQAFKIDEFKQDSSFNNSKNKIINQINIIGNKITKQHIILRELTFEQGDTLSNEDFIKAIEQSKKNILNTSLFNFSKIDIAYIDSNHVIVLIQLIERWYLFPLPIFEIDDINFNSWWRDKDYSRINYGGNVVLNNFRGRKEKLSFLAKYGFTERYRLKYDIPYLNKKQKSGISFSFSYNRRDQIVYTTSNNERLQYKNEENDAVRNYSTGISYRYRKKIFNTHVVGIGYDHNSIVDSVRLLNPNYLGNNRTKADFFSLHYVFIHDKRDSRNYPLKGRFLRFSAQKTGLGITNDFVDLGNIQATLIKYLPLSTRFFLAGSFRGLLNANNNQPYLLQNGLGNGSFNVRSYEYYVIDGQNIALAKAQLKFQIVKPRSADVGFVTQRFGKFHYAFYLGIFTDAGYVEDNVGFTNNRLANEIQFGTGIGLDFVSYYDIVIRTEYSLNKFGEHGLFIHFVAPI